MAENKFAFQMVSHLRKTPKVIYEKQFETREEAENFKETFVPIMTAIKGNTPEFKKMEFTIEEISEG